MINAIQLDINGNELKGTETSFDEKHWNFMRERFGKELRWRSIAEKAVENNVIKKEKTIKDEKTDLSHDAGSFYTAGNH